MKSPLNSLLLVLTIIFGAIAIYFFAENRRLTADVVKLRGAVTQYAAVFNKAKAQAAPFTERDDCIINLKMLEGAKDQWGLENKKDLSETPTMADLTDGGIYLKNAPVCKAGGHYTLGRLNELPTCSVAGHELP